MMRSLRMRLLMVMSVAIVCGWAVWFGCQYLQIARQQSGQWDRTLRSIGEQVLMSLPADLDGLDTRRQLRLAGDPEAISGGPDRLHFQAWRPAEGRIVLASGDAPEAPMRGDFDDGYASVEFGGERWRVFSITDAGGEVQVQVGHAESLLRAEIVGWAWNSVITALLVLLGLALALWAVVRWSLRPVLRVQDAIAARTTLDFAPLPAAGLPDEVRPLVDSFNALLGRLERALQHEREFLGEAAHELRTPLAALLTQAQVAQHSTSPAGTRQALARLVLGIGRTSRLAQQLLDSARVESARAEQAHAPVELAEVTAMVASEFELIAARRRQLILLDAEACTVRGNLDDLGILVRNLVDNGLRYGPEDGRVEIACRRVPGQPAVELSVRDDGPGVAADER